MPEALVWNLILGVTGIFAYHWKRINFINI